MYVSYILYQYVYYILILIIIQVYMHNTYIYIYIYQTSPSPRVQGFGEFHPVWTKVLERHRANLTGGGQSGAAPGEKASKMVVEPRYMVINSG